MRCSAGVAVRSTCKPTSPVWITWTTGVGNADLQQHRSGDVISVGEIKVALLHTPGHTPGSQCFLVEGRLVSGDTLFLEGCGRTDLPGSNPALMYESLQLLASLPDDTVVYPGHMYSAQPSAGLAILRHDNYIFKPKTKEAWMQWFGGADG